MCNKTLMIYEYLSLTCPLASEDAETLAATGFQIGDEGQDKIYVDVFYNRKGNIFSEPFVRVSIKFKLYEYDLDLFEYWQNQLFLEIEKNLPLIMKWKNSKTVSVGLVVYINSDNEQQRPIIYLTTEHVKLLADIGASFDFDGYV